jgi:hypothetical protein
MAKASNLVRRDPRGRLVKGSAPLPGAGRSTPHREYLAGIVREILEAPDPTGISVFERSVQALLESPDPRIVLSTLEFLAPYGYGKPVTPSDNETAQEGPRMVVVIRAPRPDRSTAALVESGDDAPGPIEVSEADYQVREASPDSRDDRKDDPPQRQFSRPRVELG